MAILNDLKFTKLLNIPDSYSEYIQDNSLSIYYKDDPNHMLDLLINTTGEDILHVGMYFVINYYFQKSKSNIEIIKKCINALINKFRENPNKYTYNLLKYLIVDLSITEVYELFDTNDILSMFIGEWYIRNEKEGFIKPRNLVYCMIPFYMYNINKLNIYDNVNVDMLIDMDIRLLILFTDHINTDYRVQYYLENIHNKDAFEIDEHKLLLTKKYTISEKEYNPFTNYLLRQEKINIKYKVSLEMCILSFKDKILFEEYNKIEDNPLVKVLVWYHHKKLLLENKDLPFLFNNLEIFSEIVKKYNLIKKPVKDDFRSVIEKCTLLYIMKNNHEYNIEDILNMREDLFNIFINSKELLYYRYYYKGELIDNKRVECIRQYQNSKLNNKKYQEMLYNKLKDDEIFQIYMRRGDTQINEYTDEYSKDTNEYNKFIREYFNRIKKSNKMNNNNIKSEMNNNNIKSELNNNNIKSEMNNNINTITNNITNNINNNNSNRRYKYIRSKPLENNIQKETICNRQIYNTCKYKRKVKIDREYFDKMYKPGKYMFIKYMSDEYLIKDYNCTRDLIYYNIRRLSKLVEKGKILDEYWIKELLSKLKIEGDEENISLIRGILRKYKYPSLYLYGIMIYEGMCYSGKKVILEYIKDINLVSDKYTMLRVLVIVNNEERIKLVIRILNILKRNKEGLGILNKYKNDSKFERLLLRVYPMVEGYDKEKYMQVYEKYKYEEEKIILRKYYNL